MLKSSFVGWINSNFQIIVHEVFFFLNWKFEENFFDTLRLFDNSGTFDFGAMIENWIEKIESSQKTRISKNVIVVTIERKYNL